MWFRARSRELYVARSRRESLFPQWSSSFYLRHRAYSKEKEKEEEKEVILSDVKLLHYERNGTATARVDHVASLRETSLDPRRKLSEFPGHRNEKTDGAWVRNRRLLFSRFVRNVAPLFRWWKSRRRSSKYFHGTTSKARSVKDDAGSPRWNIYSLAASVNLSLPFSLLRKQWSHSTSQWSFRQFMRYKLEKREEK